MALHLKSEVVMGRPRSARLAWLPPHCYPDRGRIVYKRGKMTPVRLCSEAGATYKLVIDRLSDYLGNAPDETTLRWLCEQFNESAQYRLLSAGTRRSYAVHHRTLINFKGKNGKLLGDVPFGVITTGLLQKYVDKRAEQKAPISGNREVKGYLSAVYAWALARDYLPRGMVNPCHGVERNPETACTRYVTDEELQFALARAKPLLKVWMQLAYLLAGRVSEVLTLPRTALTDEGIRVERLKGSKTNVIRWRPKDAPADSYSWLEDAANQALALRGKITSMYLLQDEKGQPLKYSRIRSMWKHMTAKCVKDDAGWVKFTPHDLKRKGISDHESGTIGGHKDPRMLTRYRVREDIEEPVG